MNTKTKNLEQKYGKRIANHTAKAKMAKKLIEDIFAERLLLWGKEDDLLNPAY